MSKRPVWIAGLALAFVAGAPDSGLPQTSPPAAGAAIGSPVPYAMTFGDMMNTLIQPRHAKLGLAGRAENWALAEYALVEIRQSFAGIVKAQPRFNGLPVGELVDAAVGQPINAVEAAIRQQNPKRFAAAYDQLTQGCNACHAAADHPFVVIETPDASGFSNQDFRPRQ